MENAASLGTWWICIIGFLVATILFPMMYVIGKLKSEKSEYEEFSMNEYNHPMTWRDRGDYE